MTTDKNQEPFANNSISILATAIICIQIIAFGCTCQETSVQEQPAVSATNHMAQVVGNAHHSSALMVADQHDNTQTWIQFVSVPDTSIATAPTSKPYPAIERYPGDDLKIPAPITHDGNGAYAIIGSSGDKHHVDYYPSLSADAVTVSLGAIYPKALLLHGKTLFVGSSRAELGWIHLDADPPFYVKFVERSDSIYKAYDMFARAGNHVLAIDDEYEPIVSDLFLVDKRGNPNHLAQIYLPIASYKHAIILPPSPENGHFLYLMSEFRHFIQESQQAEYAEHRLTRLEIIDSAVIKRNGEQGKRSYHNSAYEIKQGAQPSDHGMRRSPHRGQLIAGKKYTRWLGMAVTIADGSPVAWVAAGDRGILRFGERPTEDSRPSQYDMGAPCLDIIAIGNTLYAILGGESPSVAQLAHRKIFLTITKRVELGLREPRFVR